MTGDTLFIGDVGRPDLMASVGITATELAGRLYDSLHQKLLTLPDETLVYPAHGAGSMCGRNLSSDTVSPLGVQRQLNYALQPMSKEAFVALVTADQPEAPAYFAYDAMLNRRERPTLSQTLQRVLRPLGLDEVVRRLNAGMQVLDVRQPADFARQHLAGSVNISLGGAYATWAGTVLDQQQPIAPAGIARRLPRVCSNGTASRTSPTWWEGSPPGKPLDSRWSRQHPPRLPTPLLTSCRICVTSPPRLTIRRRSSRASARWCSASPWPGTGCTSTTICRLAA